MDQHSFIYCHTEDKDLPAFGYKIHLSATWENYKDIKALLIPLLDERSVAYKYLKNDQEVWTNFSVEESLAESGKFFTIYPQTHQECLDLLEDLYASLPQDLEGIYIMSDRPYRDSKVIFYRYGTIDLDKADIKKGLPTLIGPDGQEWQDDQKTYFDLPAWIEDIQPDDTIEESYLGNHYEIDSIQKSTAGGNIYLGRELRTQQAVVMKESRPHILQYGTIKKELLRAAEYRYASLFDQYVPTPLEEVQEWLNRYYIYEKIEGVDFYQHVKDYAVFSYRSETQDDLRRNLALYRHSLDMADKLLELLSYFHQKDFILHDIHPANLMVDGQDNLFVVDLEYAYPVGKEPFSGIYHTIALKEWNSLDGKLADVYKVANLLLYCLARLQIKSREDLPDHLAILDHLLETFGIETRISDFFTYLFSPHADLSTARKLLSTVKMTTKPSQNTYALDFSELAHVPDEEISFLQRVAAINKTLPSYREALGDEEACLSLMDGASDVGLTGLLGSLVLLKDQLSQQLMSHGLSLVAAELVETDSGRVLAIGEQCASPYFDRGNAGYIQALIYLDSATHISQILELAETFSFEFAQGPGYLDGMLGIADALLAVFDLVGEPKYLQKVGRLLLQTSFYVAYGKVEVREFAAVLRKYKERVVVNA